MPLNPKRLAQFVATTSEATYYTVTAPALVAIVRQVLVANTSASPATLSLSVVPVGNAAGNANRVIPGVSIPANALVSLDLDIVLAVGDFLSALASANTSLTVTVSGMEQT